MLPNQIKIEDLKKPDWKQASAEIYADPGLVTVWRAAVSSFVGDLEDLQTLLDPQEMEKAMRYRNENDRQQRIISKAVLRILLSRFIKVNPKKIQFQSDQNKKPYLYNPVSENLSFNVSHSGNWILIAINTNLVGIDVEQMNASFTYQNMLSFSFNAEEIDFVEQSEIPYQSFYQLWTRKEGLLKATGKGLVDDLAQVPSLDGIHETPATIIGSVESWNITSFKVDENHIGSVSFMPIKTALAFFNFEL